MSQLLRKLLLLASLAIVLGASAHDFEVDGIYYLITSSTDKTVAVSYRGSSYNSYSNEYQGEVNIPATVVNNGITYSVTAIGGSAFYDCSGLASVTIPNSVTSIGSTTFFDCTGLTSVTIPNSVTSIGSSAFIGCSGLVALDFNATDCSTSGTPGHPAFPSSISSLTIGEGVTRIPAYFLYYGSKIQNLNIPNSVTSIGDYAFNGCSGLTSVTIPNSVTAIGDYAFRNCSGLEALDFNATDCSTCGYLDYPAFPSSISSLTIGDGVTRIPAFFLCNGSKIQHLNIPNSVTSIGGSAFRDCLELTSVSIPNSVTAIGDYAFRGCSELVELNFNATDCSTCGSQKYPAFPSSISSLTIGDSVTRIPAFFLYNGSKIQNLNIPSSVSYIGDYAFRDCSELVALDFNATDCSTCGSPGCPAFPSSISSLTIGDGVTSILHTSFTLGVK